MSATQLLGAFLVALPFLALAVWIVIQDGWAALFVVYGFVAAVYAVLAAGAALLNGSPS